MDCFQTKTHWGHFFFICPSTNISSPNKSIPKSCSLALNHILTCVSLSLCLIPHDSRQCCRSLQKITGNGHFLWLSLLFSKVIKTWVGFKYKKNYHLVTMFKARTLQQPPKPESTCLVPSFTSVSLIGPMQTRRNHTLFYAILMFKTPPMASHQQWT